MKRKRRECRPCLYSHFSFSFSQTAINQDCGYQFPGRQKILSAAAAAPQPLSDFISLWINDNIIKGLLSLNNTFLTSLAFFPSHCSPLFGCWEDVGKRLQAFHDHALPLWTHISDRDWGGWKELFLCFFSGYMNSNLFTWLIS